VEETMKDQVSTFRRPASTFLAAFVLAASFFLAVGAGAQETGQTEAEAPKPRREVKAERARVVESKDGAAAFKTAPRDTAAEDTAAEDTATRVDLPEPSPPPVGHRAVHEVRLVVPDGGRVEAARQDEWIAFDRLGSDGFHDVYLLDLDGGSETCLTCDNWEFNKRSALSPTWHPSGEYLVLQVQEDGKKRGLTLASQSTPARGLGSDLWFITRDGRDAWQFTRIRENGRAVLDPHFSVESEMLVWSERIRSRSGGPWGDWQLRVAPVHVKRRVPRLAGDGRYYTAGIGLARSHGFSADDGGIYVSASSRPGLLPDIVRIDLETGVAQPITSAPAQYDDAVLAVPYSDYLVWTTNRGLGKPSRLHRTSELWLRSTSGLTQERLTFFNDSGSDHFLDEALVDDLSWMADGERLLMHVLSAGEGVEFAEGIYLVKLGRDYRRERDPLR
jgi:hypothetical protein